jgi:hypothetical protein
VLWLFAQLFENGVLAGGVLAGGVQAIVASAEPIDELSVGLG